MREAITKEKIEKLKEKVELQRKSFNGKEYIAVVGKVELPSLFMPNDDAINIYIDFGGKKHIALLNPRNIKCCDALLADGRTYEFICEETPEMLVVKWYSSETRANKDDADYDEEVDNILREVDEELFNLVCMLYEGENFAFINFEKYAEVMDYEQCGEETKIRIKKHGIEYECIYDNDMPHKSEPEKLEVGKVLFFEGVFVYDKIYLKNIYDKKTAHFLKNFNRLSDKQKKEINHIMQTGSKFELVNYEEIPAFVSTPAMYEKYELIKEYYPTDVQKAVEITKADTTIRRTHERDVLNILVNTTWNNGISVNTDYEYLMNRLNEQFYGQHSLKDEAIKIILSYANKKKNKGMSILLHGPSGVGKTSLFRAAFEAAGIPVKKIPLNGAEAMSITGSPRIYENATAGLIAKAIHKIGNMGAIILDEVDKMIEARDSSITALCELLDPNEGFTDNLIESELDISNIIFVLTANNISAIPNSIIDRVHKIYVSGYTADEKTEIVRYVIAKKIQNYELKRELIWTDDAISLIAKYTVDNGARGIEKNIDSILRNVLKVLSVDIETVEDCNNNSGIVIDEPFVKKSLGSEHTNSANAVKSFQPGMTKALGIIGNTGMTFLVQITDNPYGISDEITGLPKQSTIDSIKIAKLLVSKKLKKELPRLHISFSCGGIDKEGPSAGAAIFGALYSCLIGKTIDPKIALTGEIDIFSNVLPVGAIETKIAAAQDDGCTTVIIPEANYRWLVDGNKLERYKCKIVSVSTCDEICEILFCN